MATLSFNNGGSEVSNGLPDALPLAGMPSYGAQTSTSFGLDLGGDAVVFIGTGFSGYVNGRPTTGTITGYQLWDLANTLPGYGSVVLDYTVSGLSMSVSDFNTFVNNSDGVGFRNAVYGGADSITGGDNADELWGYGAADTINAGAGADTIYATGGLSGETYNGGSGVDTLEVGVGDSSNSLGAAADFSAATITSIERLRFNPDNAAFTSVVFSANQFSGAGIVANPVIEGNGLANAVFISMPSAATFDISATTFVNWTPGLAADRITITGSSGADTIIGSTSTDLIFGDASGGGGGVDTLHGGDGADFLDGLVGADLVYGEGGADIIRVSQGEFALNEVADGGAGTDTLLVNGTVDLRGRTVNGFERISMSNAAGTPYATFSTSQINTGFTSNVLVTGSAGVDWIAITGGSANLSGWTFANWSPNADIGDALLVQGSAGGDTLVGSSQNDSLQGEGDGMGGSGVDLLYGGDGDDYLDGWGGADQAYGQGGNDEIQIWSQEFVIGELADGGAGTDTLALFGTFSLVGATLTGFERLYLADETEGGSPGRATISVNISQLTAGFGGNPVLVGSAQAYTLAINAAAAGAADLSGWTFSGWNGANAIVVQGGVGSDVLVGSSQLDVLVGGAGDDTLVGGAGNDTLLGGGDWDTVSYASAASYVTVDLRYSTQQNTDGGGLDTIDGVEHVIGSNYDDRLWGNSVGNKLYGLGGDDQLDGGLGNDTLDGGSGFDTANYGSATSYVTIDLDYGSVQNTDAAGLDTFASIERVIGGNYDDRFWGSDANNFLHGGIGQDQLNGRGGEDLLDGGANHDILTGGSGPDVFVFRSTSDTHWDAPDRITDFAPGDRIDIGDIDADTSVGGDQAFHIAVTPEAAGVYITYDAGSNRTTLRLDINGDGNPDGRIWLDGDHRGLTNADFVL